jgi:Ca2+-transporting ATPase
MGEFNYGHIGCSSSCHKEVYQRADDEATTGRTDPLITNIMWRNLLAQAFY